MFADFNLVLLLQGAERGHGMPVEFPLPERPVVLALPQDLPSALRDPRVVVDGPDAVISTS